jgi:hypothetical protein
MTTERVSIDQAFQLLLRDVNDPYVACEQLNAALRMGRVKLFADGAKVKPGYFARILLVVADAAPDGRWTASITQTISLAVIMPKEWTVTGIEGLLKPPRRKPGTKPKYKWDEIKAEIARRCTGPQDERPREPDNISQVARDVADWYSEQYGDAPEDSAMRDVVKRVCQ